MPPLPVPTSTLLVSVNVTCGFVNGGETVTVKCTYPSSVAETDWTFQGGSLPRNAAFMNQNSMSLLTITNFTQSNTGKYTCFARSAEGVPLATGEQTSYLELDGM